MTGQGLIFIISGPSGSGKTTLVKKLLSNRRLSKNIQRAVSFTSRPIRKREADAKDYFFISRQEFKKREALGEFVETKSIVGNLYGTSRSEFDKITQSGKDAILCIDVRGAKDVRRMFTKDRVVSIFILPPSINELVGRLKDRSSENREEIKKRLGLAKEEMRSAPGYDYVVINNKLSTAVKKLEAIITSEIVRRRM
ncbi:MAG: guanylate kinase [Candidatus Omnitrophota bacterium]